MFKKQSPYVPAMFNVGVITRDDQQKWFMLDNGKYSFVTDRENASRFNHFMARELVSAYRFEIGRFRTVFEELARD